MNPAGSDEDIFFLLRLSHSLFPDVCVRESEAECIDGEQTDVAGVLDEPYSQLTPLRGVAIQARQST
jgi:hypothetical protein